MYTSQLWPKYKKINDRAIFVLLYKARPKYKKINYRAIFVLLYIFFFGYGKPSTY